MTQAAASLRQAPGFRLYATARVLSWGGSSVSWIALPVAMYQQTASPLWTACVAVAEAVPYLVLGLLAGTLVDRSRHLTVMVRADLLSGAILLTIPGAHLLGILTPLQLLAAACLVQSAFVFYDAANFAFLPILVGRERILPANGLLFAGGSATEAMAPAVAGALLAVVAAPLLVAVDALSFLASALLLGRAGAAMGKASEAQPAVGNLVASILEGIRYLAGNKLVAASTCVSALLTMANGGLVALLVVWAHESFGIVNGDPRLGLVYAGVATAGVTAGIVTPQLAHRLGSLSSLRILVALAATASYAMLAVKTWWAAAVLLLTAGTCNTASIITMVSLRQQVIPQALQGRVNTTARTIAFGAGYATGAMAAGALAERMSAICVADRVPGARRRGRVGRCGHAMHQQITHTLSPARLELNREVSSLTRRVWSALVLWSRRPGFLHASEVGWQFSNDGRGAGTDQSLPHQPLTQPTYLYAGCG